MKNSFFLKVIVICFCLFWYCNDAPLGLTPFVSNIVVNDFNDDKTNLLGHNFDKNLSGGGKLTLSFIMDMTSFGKSRVLKLEYDVTDTGSQAIYYENLGDPEKGFFDAESRKLKYLSFFLRGSIGSEKFNVALVDVEDNYTKLDTSTTVVEATKSWQKKQIQLKDLKDSGIDVKAVDLDIRRLKAINFSFYWCEVNPSNNGIVFIDKIMFEWE